MKYKIKIWRCRAFEIVRIEKQFVVQVKGEMLFSKRGEQISMCHFMEIEIRFINKVPIGSTNSRTI